MNMKRDFRADLGQLSESRNGNSNVITNARRLEDDLIRLLGKNFPAEMSNHAEPFIFQLGIANAAIGTAG
jgi:hypothetical protein